MERIARQALKRKYKRLTWWTLGWILLFALNIVLLVTIDWRPQFLKDATGIETTWDFAVVFIVVLSLFIPIILALTCNVRSIWAHRELYDERRRMYKERLRLYVEWFFEAVTAGDYKKAKDLHNDFIWGDVKSLTRGVMVGILSIKGDKDDVVMALKHMSKIPDEVYNPNDEKS